MNKLEPDPRVTQGPGFFNALIEWMRRAALAVNALVDGKSETDAALATKADIDSPTFTGDPKAPTPANSDNDTSIATTAWVRNALGNIFTSLGFAFSFGGVSYIKLPSVLGGWVVQWGATVLTTNGAAGFSISLPMTFPTALRSYLLFNGDNAAALTNQTTFYGQTSSSASALAGVAINTTTGGGVASAAVRINWVAFGN